MLNAVERASGASESGENAVGDENEHVFVEVEGRKVPFDPHTAA